MAYTSDVQNKVELFRRAAKAQGLSDATIERTIATRVGAEPVGLQSQAKRPEGLLRNITRGLGGSLQLIGGGAFEAGRGAIAAGARSLGREDIANRQYVNPNTGKDVQNPFLRTDELEDLSGGIGRAGKIIAKKSAGTASLIPTLATGGATTVGRAALAGAAGAGLQEFSEKDTNIGNVAKAAAVGGVTGGLFQKLSKVLKARSGAKVTADLRAYEKAINTGNADDILRLGEKYAGDTRFQIHKTLPGILDDKGPGTSLTLGQKVRKRVLNPKADATPFFAENQKKLQLVQEKLGLKGSSTQMLEQLPKKFREADTAIKTLLKDAPDDVTDSLQKSWTNQLEKVSYLGEKKVFDTERKIMEKRIAKAGLNPLKRYQLKAELAGEMSPIFKKRTVGNPLLPKEAAVEAGYNALKESLDGVSPKIRELNNLQQSMYELSEGLVQKAQGKGGINLPIVGQVPGTKEFAERATDFTGRSLEKAGGIRLPKVPSLDADISKAELFGQAAGRASTNPQRTVLETPELRATTTSMAEPTAQAQGIEIDGMLITPAIIQKAIMIDSLRGGKNQKQLMDVLAAMEASGMVGGSGVGANVGKVAAKDYLAAETGLDSLKQVEKIVATSPSKLALTKLPFSIGARDYDAATRNVMDAILRLRTGAAVNKSEEELYNEFIPSFLDPVEVRQQKITRLRKYFGSFIRQGDATGIGSADSLVAQ